MLDGIGDAIIEPLGSDLWCFGNPVWATTLLGYQVRAGQGRLVSGTCGGAHLQQLLARVGGEAKYSVPI